MYIFGMYWCYCYFITVIPLRKYAEIQCICNLSCSHVHNIKSKMHFNQRVATKRTELLGRADDAEVVLQPADHSSSNGHRPLRANISVSLSHHSVTKYL